MIDKSTTALDRALPTSTPTLPQLSGYWLNVARTAWMALALITVAILCTSIPGYASTFGGDLPHLAPQHQNTLTAIMAVLAGVASLCSALLSLILATMFFRRRFTEQVAAGLSFYLLLYASIMAGPLEIWIDYWLHNQWLAPRLQALLLAVPSVLLMALLPNGRFVPAWSRWLPPLALIWSISPFLIPSFDGTDLTAAESIIMALSAAGLVALFGAGIVAQVTRYRRIASFTERQQLKWVIYGFGLWLGYVLLSSLPYFYLNSLPAGTPMPWWGSVSVLGWFLALNIMPVSLAISVARYRLWNIDVLINRTLVYGILTVIVVGLYALMIGAIGALLHAQGDWLLTLIVTGVLAVVFQPLRDYLQRRVNRLLYGHRDEPIEVLARLSQRLADALEPDRVLPALVETIAHTLKLPYAAIVMRQGDELRTAASIGVAAGEPQRFPLIYQGVDIGQLLVAPRGVSEIFAPAETQLLRNIARQAGSVVHAQQLTADLQLARRQIVAGREEERRRLRRDLHDGLGPSLAAQLLKIGSARALLHTRPEVTDQLLAEMETDIETTLAEVRRIVYDLRPPALDQWGLAGALRAYAETCENANLAIRVEAPETLPPLPAAVEVAAYHIGREALANVVRHSEATHCILQLCVQVQEQRLLLVIRDNGRGILAGQPFGVGLTSMHERAVELGGSCTIEGNTANGTTITANFPLISIG